MVDVNIGRVENEGRSLRVVIYLKMCGIKPMDLNLLMRTGI